MNHVIHRGFSFLPSLKAPCTRTDAQIRNENHSQNGRRCTTKTVTVFHAFLFLPFFFAFLFLMVYSFVSIFFPITVCNSYCSLLLVCFYLFVMYRYFHETFLKMMLSIFPGSSKQPSVKTDVLVRIWNLFRVLVCGKVQ